MDVQVGDAGWRNEDFSESNRGKMHVFFHSKPVKHNYRSLQEKRPIFIEKIFITKLVPGDSRLVIDRPMRDTDAEEFPVEWARYEQKKANVVAGTPLDAWPILSDIQKAEFRALNIFTIDQFANLADEVGNRIMGFNDLRNQARAFIRSAKDSEFADKILAESNAKISAMDKEMQELREMVAKLSQPKPKGRPPKVRDEQAAV